jgi:hypothetical protein
MDVRRANRRLQVLIHYVYRPSKYDEWIDVNSGRIAPHGSHICELS